MSLVFVHDHKFRRVYGRVYSPGGLPNNVLSRYVNWFGQVTVVGRIIDEDQTKKSYSEITNPNIHVVTGESLKSLIESNEYVIARLPSINGYKAIHYARQLNKPYLVEVVGCTLDAYWNYGIKGKLLALPAFLVMRDCVKYAPYALYVTSSFLQKRYPCKGHTIGVSDVSIEKPDDSVIIYRQNRIRENKKKIIIGTAGAIDVNYKGQEYVIRALSDLSSSCGIEFSYELAGSGDKRRLRKIAEECGILDKVVFRGVIKHDEMNNWYDTIDLYIQSSLLEGLSRALVEAMSRGLPCIAANVGGNPELIDKDYLFPTKNKKRISLAISDRIKRITNQSKMEEVSQKNYTVIKTLYNAIDLEKKREAFYKDFILSFGNSQIN